MTGHEADHGMREAPRPWDAQIRAWLRDLSGVEQKTLIAQWLLRRRRDAQSRLEALFHGEALQQFSMKVHALAIRLGGGFSRDEKILWGQLYAYMVSAIPEHVRQEMRQKVDAVLSQHLTASQ